MDALWNYQEQPNLYFLPKKEKETWAYYLIDYTFFKRFT